MGERKVSTSTSPYIGVHTSTGLFNKRFSITHSFKFTSELEEWAITITIAGIAGKSSQTVQTTLVVDLAIQDFVKRAHRMNALYLFSMVATGATGALMSGCQA